MHSKQKQAAEQVKRGKQLLIAGEAELSLASVFNSKEFQQIISNCRDFRDRIYTPFKTLFIFIKQVLDTDKSCKKAVAGVVAEQLSVSGREISSNTGPYCKARNRLPEKTVRSLVKEVGVSTGKKALNKWKPYGRELKSFDGTMVKMPDTAANQAAFPQHGNQKKGAGFPLARLVVVMSLTVGTVIDYAIGAHKGKGTGEHSLLRSIFNCIEKDDIVLGDRYFPSFFVMLDLQAIGADGVFRGQSQRHKEVRQTEQIYTSWHNA